MTDQMKVTGWADYDEIKAAALALLNTNGGPIDGEDTVDGEEYVMVKRSKFEALAKAAEQGGRL